MTQPVDELVELGLAQERLVRLQDHLENALLRVQPEAFCDAMYRRATEAETALATMTLRAEKAEACRLALETRCREMRATLLHYSQQASFAFQAVDMIAAAGNEVPHG
jgi:hypothetical protein